MHRRIFLRWSGAAIAGCGVGLPFFSGCSNANQEAVLLPAILPESVSQSIGAAYLKQHPIFTPIEVDKHNSTALNRQIEEEFAAGDIMVCDGWIISTTEARYCASLLLQ